MSRSESTDEPPELTEFETLVLASVAALSPGEIVTYGELASEIGKPGAARAVGSVLRRHGGSVPWWRVVASTGRLVPGGEKRHRAHLAAEGVPVRNGRVVMTGPDAVGG